MTLFADQLSESGDALFVRNFVTEGSLFSIPDEATHYTWLDLCLVDAQDKVTDYWKTETSFISGHDLVPAILDIRIHRQETSNFTYRDFKSIDVETLAGFLDGCDWSGIPDSGSLEAGIECLYSNLFAALDALAPVKTY